MRDVVGEIRDDRVTGLAAEIAFFVILSVFPALLVVAAGLGFLGSILGGDVADEAQAEVVDFLQSVLTDDAADTVDAVRSLFVQPKLGLLTFGLVSALWALSRGFAAVMSALSVAYDVEETRGWVRRRRIALLLSLGSVVVAVLMLAMLVVGPLLGAGGAVADAIGLGSAFATAWDWIRLPATVVVLVLWAATVLHVAPDHHSPWRSDLPGAVLIALWWLVASFCFRLGIAASSGANQVFGVLGGSLILLMWIYVLGLGLLIGGELNAVLHRREPSPVQGWDR